MLSLWYLKVTGCFRDKFCLADSSLRVVNLNGAFILGFWSHLLVVGTSFDVFSLHTLMLTHAAAKEAVNTLAPRLT